ncbi:hypothetical protein E4T42_05674 [Aureobasidium subglaciale]|nr:hypothetical protein E4T42_05674 [Aureobasidium subglaciale]
MANNIVTYRKNKMASFVGLAPEVRLIIYSFLLEEAFASNKRVVYAFEGSQQTGVTSIDLLSIFEAGDSDLEEDVVPVIAWTRDTMEYEQDRTGRFISLVDVLFRYGPEVRKRAVHHANIDGLLALGGTCRLLRSEVLPIAWSIADISVYTPDNGFKDDIQYIFGHCLSEQTCKLIRTLYIDVGKSDWSVACSSETASFITKSLPNLSVLTIAISRRYTTGEDDVLNTGLMALTIVPSTISIEIVAYVRAHLVTAEWFPVKWVLYLWWAIVGARSNFQWSDLSQRDQPVLSLSMNDDSQIGNLYAFLQPSFQPTFIAGVRVGSTSLTPDRQKLRED